MRLLLTAALLLCASVAARAAVVIQYATAGSATSLAPTVVDATVSGDDLVAGSGLNVQNFSTFNFTGWDIGSTDFAAAVTANDFWSWGFDVTAPGATIALETMDIRLDRSGSGPDDFEIRGSVNGGAESTLLTHDFADSGSAVDFLAVDISALGTVATGDSVEFVLAAFNSESDAGTFDLETVDFGGSDPRALRIEGTITAIPEPGALLVCFGITGVLALRRRR